MLKTGRAAASSWSSVILLSVMVWKVAVVTALPKTSSPRSLRIRALP